MTRRGLVSVAVAALLTAVAGARQAPPPPPSLPVRAPMPSPPQAGTGMITGQVTSTDNPPRAVRKVRVTLNMVGRGMPGRTATTDDGGRFEFRDLPVGRFNLQAYRHDYVRMNYGARRPDRPGTPIALADGERRDGIVIALPRGGVITGVVRDASGAPMSGITVRTMSFGYSSLSGERQLGLPSAAALVRTDDRGIYRAWGLAAGEYVIKVDAPVDAPETAIDETRLVSSADVQRVLVDARSGAGGFAAAAARTTGAPQGAPVKYASIYYPGTPEMASARTITIGAGEERDGVDIQMQLARTARVEGSVRASQDAPNGALNLTLAPTFIPGQAVLAQPDRPLTAVVNRGGRFSFAGIAPGRYTLTGKMSGPAVWWATADIVVDGVDLDVPLELQPPMVVNGRLTFQGAAEAPRSFGGTRFILIPPGSGSMIPNESNGGEVDAEGKFQIRAVVPGTYHWTYFGGPPTGGAAWALKDVVANGRVVDGPLQIRSNENLDLNFVFHDQPTELAGTLEDASGRAASDYFVVVFPADRTLWLPRSRRIQSLRPATDGQFSARGLPAGEYLIAAVTDLASGEQYDPALLASLVSASLKVTLTDGQKTTQDLRLAGR